MTPSDKIVGALHRSQGQWVGKRTLERAANKNRVDTRLWESALQRLLLDGTIEARYPFTVGNNTRQEYRVTVGCHQN